MLPLTLEVTRPLPDACLFVDDIPPNHPQANLSPKEAAEQWSTVKAEAELLGAEIVSPAVNFCGGNCNRDVSWFETIS